MAVVHDHPREGRGGPAYELWTLGSLRERGVSDVMIFCVEGRCRNYRRRSLAEMIDRYGRDTTLLQIARRTRCGDCRHHGAHIQPVQRLLPDPRLR